MYYCFKFSYAKSKTLIALVVSLNILSFGWFTIHPAAHAEMRSSTPSMSGSNGCYGLTFIYLGISVTFYGCIHIFTQVCNFRVIAILKTVLEKVTISVLKVRFVNFIAVWT